MKKRHIAMLSLGALMACTLGLGVFTACDEGGGDAVKPSEYLDGINYYYGDGNDVHLQGWFVSENNDAWKVEEGVSDGGSTVTKLGFNKNTANNSFSVQIDGEYSDFKYLNITMRAEARGSDRAIAAHLSVANPIPQKDHLNVLGSDLYFDVSADVYTTYTFLVPSVSRQTLDVADYVRLAPDPGIQNTGTTLYTGDIYVKDCWFSKEAPADGVTPVDDTWRTEAWCGYTVTRGGADSEATISYEHPADWSRFYRPVPLEEVFLEDGTVNNMLRIRFTSDAVTVGDVTLEDSVEQFQVGLWGDPDPTSDAQFWQSWFGQYSSYGFANGSHSSAATMTVEKDEETGIITLTCQAAPALIGLAGNFEEQLWICFNLESQPQGGEPGGPPGYIAENTPFDGVGQMTILSSEFYYDETMPEYREPIENESGWSQNGVGAYVISSEKAGVMANVTFDNISPTAWSCLAYDANSGGKTVAVLTLRNNGSEKVLYGIDWNSEANRQYGFLEAGETKEVRLENASASGVINFFLDSCYDANDPSRLPDKEEYSGDVDIISLTYEEGDAPVVPVTPGWAGAAVYTVSEEDGITNVVYEGIAPSGWTCIAYDTADANGRTAAVLTIRNNGTEKVLYGIDWNDQNARVYGFLEAGETKEVRVENASAGGVINFFLDSCYDANDPTRLPDKEEYSGDVDIVSLTYEEGDAPVVPVTPGWSGADVYTVSEENGITNVVYEGIAPSGWTCIAYDTADANGKTAAILTIRNNGTEKVLYGIDWNDQNARVYGFLEAGETKEVRVENASASGPINFFIDSCYDANDPARLPEKDSYSGNVDILSLVYADGPAPVVPSDSAWAGAAVYTVSEEDGVTNVTYEGVAPQDWTCISYGVTDAIRRPVVFLTVRNNGEKKMLYGIDLDNADARVYGYLEPGEIKQLRLESAEAYTVINFFLDSCYYGAPYESYTDSYSGSIDILALEFAAEDEVIDITANTDKVFPTGRVKLTWAAANGADVTVSCTKDGAPAEDMTPVFGEYMTITELGTYVFTFEADGAVTAVWVVRCVERPIYIPDPEPDPEPESAWVDSGTGSFDITPAVDGSVQVTYDKTEGPRDWSCVTFDASDKIKDYNTVVVTLWNNGSVPAYVGVNWGSDTDTYATERKYVTIAAGAEKTIEVPYYGSTLSRAIDASVNIFIDSCYASETDKPTTFSGSVTIVSVDFLNKEPAETSPWSGAGVYTVTAEEGVSNITYSDVLPTGWTCVSYQVSDEERQNTVIVTLRNNGTEKVLYGINLDDPKARVYGYLEAGETKEVKVQSANAYTAIDLFLDSCYYGDPYAPEKDSYSGNVDILGVKFTAEQPEEPEEPDDPEPEEPVQSIWRTDAANLSISGNTVTLNALPIDAWQNINTDISLSGECTITLSITNRTGAIAKFKLSAMKDTESGWADLEGNGTTVCWMEIPADATYELTITVSATDAPLAKHLMLMIDCWATGDKVTETGGDCPAGPYSGTVELGELNIETSAPEVPSEEDITASLTFEKAAETDPTTINGTTLSWENLTVGSWDAGFKAEYDLDDYRLAIVINIRNTSDHTVRFYAAARTADWGASAFGETRVVAESGESVVLTIFLTGEQPSQVGLIVLYGEIWETWDTESYDQRPADENGDYLTTVSGSMEIVSVKVS